MMPVVVWPVLPLAVSRDDVWQGAQHLTMVGRLSVWDAVSVEGSSS